MHPFGHGKELYFWTLMVAIIFFAVGGGVSVYEGIGRVAHPEPLQDATWSYVVLGIAAALDGSSFAIGYGNFRREAAGRGFWETIVTSKDPSLFTVVLEDAGDLSGIALAFLGIFLGHRLDNPRLDGVAAIGIGLIMAGIATVLTIQSKGLLIGERADVKALARIRAAALEDPVVRAVHRPMTMHLGPHDVLVGLGVEFQPSLTAAELASTIDRLEQRIRQEEPEATHIYVEAESLKVVEGR
jgi:cation diffusion facilitator family transporter